MGIRIKSRFKHRAMIDITSLIDLVFLLVVFFMVTSSMGSESSITVHLPRAVQTGDYKTGNFIVSVNNKNEFFLDDVKFDKKDLLVEFKKLKNKLGNNIVVIRGDKNSNYESIVTVIDHLNQAGISKFSISTIK